MKTAIKTILIVFITIVAALAIILVFKGISTEHFLTAVKKIGLTALIVIVLAVVFQLAKKQ